MDLQASVSTVTHKPKMCRLCLGSCTTCFSLIEDSRISGMLEALTSLRILPSDTISTVTCLKCFLNLKLAFRIQQNMLNAERRFRRQLPVTIKQEFDDENVELKDLSIEDNALNTDEDIAGLQRLEDVSDEYPCDICGKKWSSRSDLSRHKNNVHMQVGCSICGKVLKKGNLKAHMDNKHAVAGEIHACDMCGVEKSSKVALYKHKHWVHKLKKCHICGICTTSAILKKHLLNHPPIETTEAPIKIKLEEIGADLKRERHICDICGVEKSSKQTVVRHKHSVHKISQCSVCYKVVKAESLRKHVQRHTVTIKQENTESEREYFCDM